MELYFPYKAPPAIREWIYRDLYSYSAWVQILSGQTDWICMPCCKFWPVDEKQVYLDSTHLNNSDKFSRIIYGADKMHVIIY